MPSRRKSRTGYDEEDDYEQMPSTSQQNGYSPPHVYDKHDIRRRARVGPSAPPIDDLEPDERRDVMGSGGGGQEEYPNAPPPPYSERDPRRYPSAANGGHRAANGHARNGGYSARSRASQYGEPDQWSISQLLDNIELHGPLRVLYPLLWIVRKLGWYILVIMFPFIFGPIFAIRKMYSRSKRTYQAARYAHNKGYLTSLWEFFREPLLRLVALSVRTATLGQVDITDYLQREYGSPTQRTSSLRSGRRWRADEADDDDDSMASSELEQDLRSDAASFYGRLLTPVTGTWSALKMLFDMALLAGYALFGWTFGRFEVDEEGQLTTRRKQRARQAARGNLANGHEAPPPYPGGLREQQRAPRWWPWIFVVVTALGISYYTYNYAQRYHPRRENKILNM